MISLKSRADHWALTVPDFRTLISARNGSFFGDFGRSGTAVEIDPGNEEFLAAISSQNAGFPDWRRVGRNSPRTPPEVMGRPLGINGA